MALLLFWIPVAGLPLVGLAIYWAHYRALPNWLSFLLVPAMLGGIVATVVGIAILLIQLGILV